MKGQFIPGSMKGDAGQMKLLAVWIVDNRCRCNSSAPNTHLLPHHHFHGLSGHYGNIFVIKGFGALNIEKKLQRDILGQNLLQEIICVTCNLDRS
ncbi:hypothetical protein RRG08_003153 [Elysia crispata]|uniref:Uncharacterized protein n=1 Tax=Elysia crispata TaxID=231223 RepID=A0AAE1B796_9GAST|nr:hypothetical protein RRG08_003153 [Elysia crispata]